MAYSGQKVKLGLFFSLKKPLYYGHVVNKRKTADVDDETSASKLNIQLHLPKQMPHWGHGFDRTSLIRTRTP